MNFPAVDPKRFHLYRPPADSHKGQNGKLLVIGGSKLFHSSIFWAADVASRVVDLVHFTSPANENNDLVRKKIKEGFWNGIVVDWKDVGEYIEEDDCVLIGPGMTRMASSSDENASRVASRAISLSDRPIQTSIKSSGLGMTGDQFPRSIRSSSLAEWGKKDNTKEIVDYLLKKFPEKRWVVDGGALTEVDLGLITENCILTPHKKEFLNLMNKVYKNYNDYSCADLSQKLRDCTILLKGPVDTVCQGSRCIEIAGGNPGMTKGGTGDVLAGLVAAFYCKNSAWTAATAGSWVVKRAGNSLHKRVGPYFNAADLLQEVPKILWETQGVPEVLSTGV